MNEAGDERTHAIIGAAMEVHTEMGKGFLEPVYQDALAVEFDLRRVSFAREPEIAIFYKGNKLRSKYRPDFFCLGEVIVELKALPAITNTEISQVLNYLKATKLQLALILNFGTPKLEIKRVRLDPNLTSGNSRQE